MYPLLFQLGPLRVETYYLFWLAALSLAMIWIVRRFPLYEVDDDEARRVIGWAFVAMLAGARGVEYLRNFKEYAAQPSLLLDLHRGGLSEVGAFAGAFFAALFLCRRSKKLSFGRLCDVVALPATFTVALGRWGCFFNGCCVGIPSHFPLALHFPYDPAEVLRHPTQLYYSGISLLILLVLWTVERFTARRGRFADGALITPLGLILYTAMRFGVDLLRADGLPVTGVGFSHYLLLAALPLEFAWLFVSVRSLRDASR